MKVSPSARSYAFAFTSISYFAKLYTVSPAAGCPLNVPVFVTKGLGVNFLVLLTGSPTAALL